MKKLKRILRSALPEEPKNWIPCVVFGSLILTLAVMNVWKWVVR